MSLSFPASAGATWSFVEASATTPLSLITLTDQSYVPTSSFFGVNVQYFVLLRPLRHDTSNR